MIYNLIHEVAVVTNHNDTSREVLKVFLKYLKRLDVEVVGRLIENEEVRIPHKHGAEIEFSLLASRKFIHIVVLLLWGEEKMLKELRSREVMTLSEIDIVGNVAYHIYHLLRFVKLKSFLREIAEFDCFANVKLTSINGFKSEKKLEES